MAVFTVNGRTVAAEKNQKLIRFLRDELRLTSVKDGCSEGACGTCHVLIDGKPTKACVPQTDKLEGKTIVTVEGLSDFEKEVYTYAFGRTGAVQCGFCIPGMIISAKALLDANPEPTREEAAFAIRNNICRCTGYVKIIDGILLAAEIFRAGKLPDAAEQRCEIGERVPRIDVAEKVQGYDFIKSNLSTAKTLYFGDWSKMLLAFWSGIELTVDPYSLSKSGGLRLVALQSMDVVITQPKAFAKGVVLT